MNWIILKKLNQLYCMGKTKSNKTLLNDPDVQYLLQNTKELSHYGNYLVTTTKFDAYYEKYHKENFQIYSAFLTRNGLLKPQTRFEEADIRILLFDIESGMLSGDLITLRNKIIDLEETVRGVSRMFFKNEKYLLGKGALINAVKQLLKIKKFADDRDQQYKYVLECDHPEVIVLCENIDFLKRPSRPRQHNIELWYAGGKNINKLDYADTRNLPIYYSADWDYDGLKIYESIKEKLPNIQLLNPTGSPKEINATEHRSKWREQSADEELFFGLKKDLYADHQQQLIMHLVKSKEWIMEESNDLIDMVNNALKFSASLVN